MGTVWPQGFAANKEVSSSLLENAPFFIRTKCSRSVVPLPKFEMLPTIPGDIFDTFWIIIVWRRYASRLKICSVIIVLLARFMTWSCVHDLGKKRFLPHLFMGLKLFKPPKGDLFKSLKNAALYGL